MVTVTWDLVFGANLYRATAVDGTAASLNCTSASTSCQISMLKCGEKYEVHVTAVSDDCASASNASATFETSEATIVDVISVCYCFHRSHVCHLQCVCPKRNPYHFFHHLFHLAVFPHTLLPMLPALPASPSLSELSAGIFLRFPFMVDSKTTSHCPPRATIQHHWIKRPS